MRLYRPLLALISCFIYVRDFILKVIRDVWHSEDNVLFTVYVL